MLSLKPTFSLSTFTFIKRPLSSSSLSAIRVVSSAYLRIRIPHSSLICTWVCFESGFLRLPLMLVLLKAPVGANRGCHPPVLWDAQSTSQMLACPIYASKVCDGCVLLPFYRSSHKWCERQWEFLHITLRVDETRTSRWKVRIHLPQFLETSQFID